MHWRDRTQRRPAYNDPGHAHELTFSCFRRYMLLGADRAREWFADAANAARIEFDFAIWAYVLMPDHAHVLIWPRRLGYDISRILGRMKEPVGRKALRFLREHAPQWVEKLSVTHGTRTESHFWQPGGGYDRNATENRTLLSMVEYIHNNPVRAGLVGRAEDWAWSSAGWVAGNEPNSLKPDPMPMELGFA